LSRANDRLVVVGISHRTAPISIRERYELSGARRDAWLVEVLAHEAISEAVVLSTCHRTECYAAGPDETRVGDALGRALGRAAGVDDGGAALSVRAGFEAVRHLFRVTAGLDSVVIGEAEIQGQVSRAYRAAGAPSVGPALHRLFQSALAAGGRVRSNTAISHGATSIPSAGVRLAREVLGSLEGRGVLVIGTGEMGRLTLRCLRSEGVRHAFVASRRLERAERVGRALGAIPIARDASWRRVPDVDLIITATGGEAAFVTRERLEALRNRARQLVVLDLAVPRNVEETVSSLPGVFLYNVDDVQGVVDRSTAARAVEHEAAHAIIDHHAAKFWSWYRARAATPAIRAVRGMAKALLDRELERAFPPGPRDADREERLRLASGTLLNKILHGPTQAVRRLAVDRNATDRLEELSAWLVETAAASGDAARGAERRSSRIAGGRRG